MESLMHKDTINNETLYNPHDDCPLMKDIQNTPDTRNIPLQKVGIKDLRYPIVVLDKAHKTQTTTAVAELFVNLPHDFKGTHMSRFVEIFHEYAPKFSMKSFSHMLATLCTKLNAKQAFGNVQFLYFLEKQAPVSKQKAFLSYECGYKGNVRIQKDGSQYTEFFVTVAVPITTLCPCSKALSKYGAHNQRGIVRVCLKVHTFFWLEDIIACIESVASSPLYTLLKRPDEKFVTEQAYENPKFVEDIVREVYQALVTFPIQPAFEWFSVEAENFESIHNHNAYAYTEFQLN